MEKTDYRKMTAPCGLSCFNCHIPLNQHIPEFRQQIADVLGCSPDDVKCEGCRCGNGILSFLKQKEPCKVFTCTREKGIEFCCDCKDFPCDYLHPYADYAAKAPHNTKVFNLCLIKKMGLEKWAEEKSLSVNQTYFTGKWNL